MQPPVARVAILATVLTSLLPAASAQSPAERPAPAAAETAPRAAERLSLDDALELPGKLRPRAARPIGWLDETTWLGADEAPGERGRRLFAIDAASGERQPFLAPEALAAALERLPGFDAERARRAASRTDFDFTADHRGLLFAEGNDLFHYDRHENVARRLTADPDQEIGATYSPDGAFVAYLRGFDLQVVPTAGGPPRALTTGGHENLLRGRLDWVYQEEVYGRGNWQGFFWSPDSSRLAFLELDESPVPEFVVVGHGKVVPEVERWRYPKAGQSNPLVRVAVVDVIGGEPRYLDLSRYAGEEILVVRVGWTPDGAQVVLQVQDRVQTWLDLVVADPRSGETRVLFRDRTAAWIEPHDGPHWLPDGKRFLWLSERDGWRHLYLYGRDGTLERRLTEGEWEVDSIEGVTAREEVLFTGDRDDSRGSKLFALPLAGGAVRCITPAEGTHDVDVSPGGGFVVDSFSSLNDPGAVHVLRGDGTLVRTLATASLDPLARFDLAPAEFRTFATRDGGTVEAILVAGNGMAKDRRHPVLFHVYGGPHSPQVKDAFAGRSYLWHQMLAQEGYVVCVVDNRSASGKGHASTAPVYRDLGTRELMDLEDAVDALVEEGIADPARIGVWGWSYGGYLTAFAMTHSKKFRMGIAGAPVTDWRLYDSIYTERYMDLPQKNPEGYDRSSVLKAAKDLHGRLLLLHGEIDENVHLQNSLQLVEALQRAGKTFDFMIFPGNRHGVGDRQQRRFQYQLMTEFVREHL